MRVALVGAGMIAAQYAECIAAAPSLELAGATDTLAARAETIVAKHGGTAYGSLEELLDDDAVDTAVNLTPAAWHADITRRCLEAGKHVHSEKPIALRAADAWALAELARERGLRLSCAPATLLGEAQQRAWSLVREGALGRVRAVTAEANWGRIEVWHPEPEAFHRVGALADVGIYPLTFLTAMLGPVRRATGYGTILQPDRIQKDGRPFSVATSDFWVALLELESGVVVRLTASFWVGGGKQRADVELYGDEGSLWMASAHDFDATIELATGREPYEAVSLPGEPYRGVDWARALVELADALEHDRPHRMSAEHAAHVVEVLNAVDDSRLAGSPMTVDSSFPMPAPL